MVLFPLLLLQFHSVLLVSSSNFIPGKYFINCGSKSDLNVVDQHVVGDLNNDTFSVGPSSTVSATNSDTSLYDRARIFTNQTSFDFSIDEFGIFYVRLHFFPFTSGSKNLADALFDVSASNFSLLSNFGVKTNDALPVIQEYLLTINETLFSIHFTPQQNSFAFVSAIEVFLIPDPEFVMDDEIGVSPVGKETRFHGLQSQVFHSLHRHRVKIGGPQNNDSLWRNWRPDDRYLVAGGFAKTSVLFTGTLNYDVIGANMFTASDLVYTTCREMNLDQRGKASVNDEISTRKNTRYLVRLHFCDIVSQNASELKFNLKNYSNFIKPIYPYEATDKLAAPFYYDFVVVPGDSEFIAICIESRLDSKDRNAYLNGIEILEFTALS